MSRKPENEQLIFSGESSRLYRTCDGQVRKIINYRSSMYGIVASFEVELLHTIQHPYLLTGNGVSVDAEKINLFLPAASYDLLDGASYGFSTKELIQFFYQISLALLALHRQKIVHFDVKPENILIFPGSDSKLVAKLGDFGHACYLPTSQRGKPLGTALYLPPEFTEATIEDKYVLLAMSADLWSLGITFYLLFVRDFQYDIEGGKILSFAELYQKNKRLWLSGKSNENLLPIKNPVIREILTNLLTYPDQRWSIEQVVTHLEKIVTPEEHVDLVFSEKSIPDDLASALVKYCRYLNKDLTSSYLWLRRIINHLNLESFHPNEIAPVLLYLTFKYNGDFKPVAWYLPSIGAEITMSRFLELERKLFEELYPKPITVSSEQQVKHTLQQDGIDNSKLLQLQSETAIVATKSEKKSYSTHLLDTTTQEE